MNRCTKEGVIVEKLASIPKFGLEIKNRCTKEGVIGEKLASIPKSGLEIKNRCTQEGLNGEKLTSIRKFGPEIKNHCSRGAVSWRNLAVILKLTPSNQESLQLWDCFWAIPCSDSQIDPMKSRITAAFGLFPRKSMHRFPSLGLKSRITACSRPSSARVH